MNLLPGRRNPLLSERSLAAADSWWWTMAALASSLLAQAGDLFPPDPHQHPERTCFQTGQAWSPNGNLRSDVAIVYGIDPGLHARIQTWRDLP